MKKVKQLLKNLGKKFWITNKLLLWYGDFIKHTNYTKFVVLGNARTGSSFLLEGLATVQSLKMHDEIFAKHNRTYGENYDEIIAATFSKVNPSIKIVGFKLFYNHLTEEELQKFLKMKDIKIIHLTRDNKLKTIVSLDRAFKTNQWQLTKEDERVLKKITIDTSTLIERLKLIINYEKKFNELLNGRNILFVTYEKLTESPEDEFKRISTFLKIPRIDVGRINLKKQASKSIADDVENIDQLKLLLQGTPFQKYILNPDE